MSTPVTNGRATIPIDTDGLTEGQYKIQVQYNDGNYYNNASVENSILTLEAWNLINTTPTSNEWSKTPQSDGIHSTLYQWIRCTTPFPDNTITRITGNTTSTHKEIAIQELAQNNNYSLIITDYNGIETWRRGYPATKVKDFTWGTGNFVLDIMKSGGVFTISVNGGLPVTVDIESSILNTSYVSFYAENGEIIFSDVRYKPLTNGGGVTSNSLLSTSLTGGVPV